MFKNIMVPVDGSRLSEAALPAASILPENQRPGLEPVVVRRIQA